MRKLDNTSFDLRLNQILKGYKRIGEYINSKTKILILHEICNKEFEARPCNLLQGYGCPHCNSKEKLTTEKFINKVKELVKDEYTVLSNYKNYHSKVTMRHNKCKFIYEVKAGNFTSLGRRCPNCSGLIKKNKEYVQEQLDKINPNEYKVIGEYINNVTPLEIIHLECNTINKFSLKNITSNKFSCKNCKMSSGELLIKNILNNMGTEYTYQKTFKECKDRKPLPFDFFVEEFNAIIEYDGRQHFLPIFGNDENDRIKKLELIQKHDNIKNDFCKKYNLPILRIKYDTPIDSIPILIKKFLLN
ncbi:homing endonuclease [Bacillus phage AR9]|uniref:Homing endonuclease n=2 Tax=Bacillus phage PBS1 TaxID=10683 RepID=A0A172JI52_BPPB1|nr:HNH endonuclease [Bacillus phage AR9]YP_009664236.1 HNH endonuclease [Bacillus phage PBS1]AMS01231.1 homing endonuclease [Bacillus phage AR9]AST99856.1 homing endonuclease [Bacillus phage PBS1]BDE75324.1 hypothetical protein [Bacillus phage PBS1]